MSTIVTINPAIGLTSSQTYDPPPPVEYGRDFTFGNGFDVGIRDPYPQPDGMDFRITGTASPGKYVIKMPEYVGNILGDPYDYTPTITSYRIYADHSKYQQWAGHYLCAAPGSTPVYQSGQDWKYDTDFGARIIDKTIATATVPSTIVLDYEKWRHDISVCTGSNTDSETSTPKTVITVTVDGSNFDTLERDETTHNYGGVGTGSVRYSQFQCIDFYIELFNGPDKISSLRIPQPSNHLDKSK
jgi:hypothetical protein